MINIRLLSKLLFITLTIATLLFVVSPSTSHANGPIVEPGDYDAAAIYCSQTQTTPEAVQRCIDDGDYDESRADETICNNKYPHTPGSGSSEERAFQACLSGYRNGEASCGEQFSNAASSTEATILANACIFGAKGDEANNSAQPTASDTPTGPAEPLGQRPTLSSITDMEAPETQRQNTSACSLSGFMGDLICDGTSVAGQMADAALTMLGAFMKLPPLQTDPSNPLFMYWSAFRSIANIAFIIIFLIVIYSYITSLGLSNYSIKRIIPRLAAAALLVNISFYICSLFVDISNIIGSTVYGTVGDLILSASEDQAGDTLQSNATTPPNLLTSSFTWTTLAAAAVTVVPGVKAFLAWGGFAALLPVVLSVVLAVATTVIALLLRQVLIILFIIISPLAFVSIALPNTKEYFDRWWRAFIPTLMLYPVIALLFTAGTVASSILAYSVGGSGFPENLFFTIMAMGMQIVPLFFIPKAMQMGGGMLSSFMGASNKKTAGIRKAGSGLSDKLRKSGDMKAVAKDAERRAKGKRGGLYSMRANRAHRRLRNENLKQALEKKQEEHGVQLDEKKFTPQSGGLKEDGGPSETPDYLTDSPDIHTVVEPVNNGDDDQVITAGHDPEAPATDDQKRAQAAHQRARITANKVEATAKSLESANTPYMDMVGHAKGDNELYAMAAMKTLFEKNGDDGASFEVLEESANFTGASAAAMTASIEGNKNLASNPILRVPEVKDNIKKRVINELNFTQTVVIPALNYEENDFGVADIAGMSKHTIKHFEAALTQQAQLPPEERTVDAEKARNFIESASQVGHIQKFDNKVKDSRPYIENIAALKGRF